MWCKELLRWVRKLNLKVKLRSHCDDDRGKTSNHYFTVQVLGSITWNFFVQILRLQTTTHGKKQVMVEVASSWGDAWNLLAYFAILMWQLPNSRQTVTLCYRVLTSIETGSSFNRKLISWCRTLGWQFSLSEHCVNHFWYFSRIDDMFFHTWEKHDWKEALNESIHTKLCLN